MACRRITGIAIGAVAALAGPAHAAKRADAGTNDGKLAIQVNDDRLTLQMARVPQVHLSGPIDRGAPDRFAALGKQGRIPAGADVYLDSPGGDLAAAMELGRMFRAGAMVTHLGTPRRSGRDAARQSKIATCVGACAYAYFGGVYRWAPSGNDRIGLLPYRTMVGQTSPDAQAYLKDMGIGLEPFAAALGASGNGVVWLSATQMLGSGLANNGRKNIDVTYAPAPPAPYLMLRQVDRQGEHRLRLQCAPGQVTLSTTDVIGAAAAGEVVRRGTRAYFEINRQETLLQPKGGARVDGQAVAMTQSVAPNRLPHLVGARSIGAWVEGSARAYRTGFVFDLDPVRPTLNRFYGACWKAAPWSTR